MDIRDNRPVHRNGASRGDEVEAGVSIREAEFLERRLDRADRRYRAALNDLARVRRLQSSTARETAGRFGLVG
jgi:hypothetical protein